MDYFVVEHRIPLPKGTRISSYHFFPSDEHHLLVTEELFEPPARIDTPIVAVRGYAVVNGPGTIHPLPVREHDHGSVTETLERFFFNDSEIVFDTESIPYRLDLEQAVFQEPSVRSDVRFLDRFYPNLCDPDR